MKISWYYREKSIYLMKLHSFFFPIKKTNNCNQKKVFKVEKHSLQRLILKSQHILESLILSSAASLPPLCSESGLQPVCVSEVKYSHSD